MSYFNCEIGVESPPNSNWEDHDVLINFNKIICKYDFTIVRIYKSGDCVIIKCSSEYYTEISESMQCIISDLKDFNYKTISYKIAEVLVDSYFEDGLKLL